MQLKTQQPKIELYKTTKAIGHSLTTAQTEL